MTVDDLMMGAWRDRGERERLVERLIGAELRARLAEEKVRFLMTDRDSLTNAATRIVELEGIVERQNRLLMNRRGA